LFVAAGTTNGFIHIYDTNQLDHDHKHHQFKPHDDEVKDIKFVNSHMLASISHDGYFVLTCLKEFIQLQ